jgi:malonyl-CoA O-methyltransferase
MTALDPRQAYRLWAPNYHGDNALCMLENQLVSDLTPSPQGRRLAFSFGVDASSEMLEAGGLTNVATADVRALPFPADLFDLVWCRLMLGYLPDLGAGYAELGRVCCAGGQVMVTDFHADATRAGHRQTFRDSDGALHEITHYTYDAKAHLEAAAAAGLSLLFHHDGIVGPAIRSLYQQADRLDMYERDRGLAVVALFLFEKS